MKLETSQSILAKLNSDSEATITDTDRSLCADHLHFCPEWDFMAIDSDSLEYECCICEEDKL